MRQTALAVLLLSAAATISHAENLVIGVESIDQFPIYKGEGGQYSGFARELLDGFAAKYGHTIKYEPMPIVRLYDAFFKQQSVDFKFPDNPLWQGDFRKGLKVVYSKAAVKVTEGLSVLPANKGKGAVKSIGAMRGFTPWPYMDGIKSKAISFNESNDFASLIKLGESGRIDGVYANTTVINYYLSEVLKKPNLLVFDDKLPSDKADFHMASIKKPEVIAQFDEYLQKEKDSIAKLKAKYRILE